MKHLRVTILGALALLLCFNAVATVHYVTPAGAGTKSGTSWSNAYDSVAFRTALPSASYGDTFWVAAGKYTPANNRDSTFFIPSGVKVYGGFAGTETSINQRNYITNLTTLSGDIGTAGDNSDNTFNIVRFNHADSTTLLDGFTLSHANANAYGRGVPYRLSELYGGGIYNDGRKTGYSNPRIANCTISFDTAYEGGGIYNAGDSGGNASPVIINCIFSHNYARDCGAMCNNGNYTGKSSPVIDHCMFTYNSVYEFGACMDNGGNNHGESSPIVINTIFSNNYAGVNNSGGGVGGAISNGGAYSGKCNPSFTNCLFYNNYASNSGGALYNTGHVSGYDTLGVCAPLLTNCTFYKNSASVGGAITNYNAGPKLINCILWRDTAFSYKNIFNEIFDDLQHYYSPSLDTLINCDINGGWSTHATNVIDTNPMFVNPGADSFELSPASPCVNRGTNALLPAGDSVDLAGNKRVQKVIVDMGAYESRYAHIWCSIIHGATYKANICTGQTYTFYGKALTTGGTYLDTLVNSNGCDSIITLILTVNTAAITGTGKSCIGDTLKYNGTLLGVSSLNWMKGSSIVQAGNVTQYSTYGTTVAGQKHSLGYFTDSTLFRPTGVFVDSANNVYVSVQSQSRVMRWAPGARHGTQVAGDSAGSYGNASTQLFAPNDVWVDAQGNVYVADQENNRVQKWAPGAKYGVTVAGNKYGVKGVDSASLNWPTALFMDKAGNLYITDSKNYRVQKYAPGATYGVTVAGHKDGSWAYDSTGISYGTGVCADAAGNVYVSDVSMGRVTKWAPGATYGVVVAGHKDKTAGSDSTGLSPYNITIDKDNNLYIADAGNNRVQKWAPDATYGITVAGHKDGSAGTDSTSIYGASGVRLDAQGNIYVADEENNRVQKWNVTPGNEHYIATTVGTYKAYVTFSSGCSIITDSIVISYTLNKTINASICPGGSYTFKGHTYSTGGYYTDTIHIRTLCDSVITLHLTVDSVNHSNINAAICSGGYYNLGGKMLTTAGMYYDTLKNSMGCDSMVTLTLTVNNRSSSGISTAICAGGSYIFGGKTMTTGGTYYDTLTNSLGCDSVVTLTLMVNNTGSSSINAAICAGSLYTFGGTTLTTGGTYYDTLTNSLGCDSIVTLSLTVNSTSSSGTNAAVCAGSSYTFGGKTLTTTGIYYDTLTNSKGCDSVVTLNLTVLFTGSQSINDTIRLGDSITIHSKVYKTAGGYTDTLLYKSSMCDSAILSIHITVDSTICHAYFTVDSTDTVTHQVYVTNRSAGMLTHTWFFGDGDSSTAGNFTHNYSAGGTYDLCLDIVCAKGDTGSYCHHVNGDSSRIRGLHPFGLHVRQASTGAHELRTKNGDLRIYPNPFNDYIHIDIPQGVSAATITVTDILGQQVITQTVHNVTSAQLNLSALNAGVYVIQVKTANGGMVSKMVKE